jgi:hypothetical protein
MFNYKAKNIETGQSLTRAFVTAEAATEFAEKNKREYPFFEIEPTFVDGIIHNGEEEDDEDEFDENGELKMMGLDDEETSEGYDWTLEDKSGD